MTLSIYSGGLQKYGLLIGESCLVPVAMIATKVKNSEIISHPAMNFIMMYGAACLQRPFHRSRKAWALDLLVILHWLSLGTKAELMIKNEHRAHIQDGFVLGVRRGMFGYLCVLLMRLLRREGGFFSPLKCLLIRRERTRGVGERD